MLTTNDEDLAKKIKQLSAHGISSHTVEREKQKYNWYRDASEAGYNFRMSNILAAIGVAQLKRVDEMNEKRRKIASYYNKALSNIEGIDLPVEAQGCKHVYQMYTIKLKEDDSKKRELFVQNLRDNDVEASVHFSPPVHLQTYYKGNFKIGSLPVTEKLADTIVSLPIYPNITKIDMEKVSESVVSASKSILR